MTTSIKTCFKCSKEKPVTEFYRHSAMADGRLGKCKGCTRDDVKSNRENKIEYYREYDRARGSRQSPEYLIGYRTTYPLKARAHRMLNYHVRAGNIAKQPCEKCGASYRLEAHHDDYSKPLDVRWLCAAHHKEWHKLNGEGLNAL